MTRHSPHFETQGMAISGGRVAFAQFAGHEIHVFDLALGTHLYTFGRFGSGAGEFSSTRLVHAHPNGNLLVLESGNERVQEVTWAGAHVRHVCGTGMNGWKPLGFSVAHDGSLIAVVALDAGVCTVIYLLDGNTCAPVRRFYSANEARGKWRNIQFSPDCKYVVVGGNRSKPFILDVTGKDYGQEFATETGALQLVEFTHGGDVILCDGVVASVYSCKTLELLRKWTWQWKFATVYAIQTYRSSLHVAHPCGTYPEHVVLCMYE